MGADRLKQSPKVCALTLAASSDHDFGDERMVHTGNSTAPKTGRKAPQPGREGALLLGQPKSLGKSKCQSSCSIVWRITHTRKIPTSSGSEAPSGSRKDRHLGEKFMVASAVPCSIPLDGRSPAGSEDQEAREASRGRTDLGIHWMEAD